MIDFNQLVIDCGELACACLREGADLWARHEQTCRDAIIELLTENQALRNVANGFKDQAEKAEAEAKNLRKAHLYMFVDGEELTIDELRDRYTDIKMRCARLEDALDNVNRAADKLKGLYQTAEKRAEKAETEAKNLRKAHLYMFVDGEELTISQLFDRYTEIKARCNRLEKDREETKAETKRLGDQLIEAVCCREFAVNWFHRMDTECELCGHIGGPESCEASDYKCGSCKADCRCRSCKSAPEGRSNWDFAGWDKVMEIGKEGRTKQ